MDDDDRFNDLFDDDQRSTGVGLGHDSRDLVFWPDLIGHDSRDLVFWRDLINDDPAFGDLDVPLGTRAANGDIDWTGFVNAPEIVVGGLIKAILAGYRVPQPDAETFLDYVNVAQRILNAAYTIIESLPEVRRRLDGDSP